MAKKSTQNGTFPCWCSLEGDIVEREGRSLIFSEAADAEGDPT
jgi:hypothetical protein